MQIGGSFMMGGGFGIENVGLPGSMVGNGFINSMNSSYMNGSPAAGFISGAGIAGLPALFGTIGEMGIGKNSPFPLKGTGKLIKGGRGKIHHLWDNLMYDFPTINSMFEGGMKYVPGGISGLNTIIAGGRFPLDMRTNSYFETPGRFGDSRDGGSRKHAGCDLYAPFGTEVYAVKSGTVIQNPYKFYRNSSAIEIDHGNFIARYCEIDPISTLISGSYVTKGQIIGHVSDLSLNKSMLHFEMYSGNATGPLTNRSNLPYMRRSDLMDPSHYLNYWQFKLIFRLWLKGYY